MSTRHLYLSGTLICDPVGSMTPRGTPGVKFSLRKEAGDEAATALNFWCFVADLWPTLLGCRKGDAVSLIGRLRKRMGIHGQPDGHGTEFSVRQVLSVRKQSIRTLRAVDLPEAARNQIATWRSRRRKKTSLSYRHVRAWRF